MGLPSILADTLIKASVEYPFMLTYDPVFTAVVREQQKKERDTFLLLMMEGTKPLKELLTKHRDLYAEACEGVPWDDTNSICLDDHFGNVHRDWVGRWGFIIRAAFTELSLCLKPL